MNRNKLTILVLLGLFLYFGILSFTINKAEEFLSIGEPYLLIEPLEDKKKDSLSEELIDNEFEINATSALSVKIDKDGKETIIYSKNSEAILPIASLTKLMTAYIIFDLKEAYDLNQPLFISNKAANQLGVSVLFEGEVFTIETLINIFLIESSNDAAFALSEIIGENDFVRLMNLYSKEIGLENTYFINPTGLTEKGDNLSTAEDIVRLVKKIKEDYPRILEITKKDNYPVKNIDGIFRHYSRNTNLLLSEYSEIIGGKTGLTYNAKECLVVVLRGEKDTYYINVILGAENRFEEMRKFISIIF